MQKRSLHPLSYSIQERAQYRCRVKNPFFFNSRRANGFLHFPRSFLKDDLLGIGYSTLFVFSFSCM